MSNLRRVGSEAEDQAAEFLLGLGYTIVTRRHKTRGGELDLVALDGDMLVFVEVKMRRGLDSLPEEAIGKTKRSRLMIAAREYLAAMGEGEREIRFDLVAIDRDGLRHHVGLFED